MNQNRSFRTENRYNNYSLRMTNILRKIRNRYYLLADLVVFSFIPFVAFYVRFDGMNFTAEFGELLVLGLFMGIVKIAIIYFAGVYSRWWHNASIDELLLIIYSGLFIFIAQMLFLSVHKAIPIIDTIQIPFSIVILDSVFSVIYISFSRLSMRILSYKSLKKNPAKIKGLDNILIVGAGMAGITVLEEIKRNSLSKVNVIGFIDDDPRKAGMKIRGVKVLGKRIDIPEIAEQHSIKKIFIAMPSAPGNEIKDIIDIISTVKNIEILTLPPLYDIIDGKVEIKKLRKVQIEDLLKRKPIRTDTALIEQMLNKRVVLVTGGGGSIGSELCRQIARCSPSKLLLLGQGENSVFEALAELTKKFPSAVIIPIIADVTDYKRMRTVFSSFSIDIVFHAAAHKHVPLMEAHPYEAIKNNVLGTKILTDLCVEFDVSKFICISTDKAVNPTSVMGSSKRIGEMIVINAAKNFDRKFSVVRFGNVLGSRGSVVRIFKAQIEAGGPITITHPEINRYFMTIPEAVQLVLQAFIIGNGGDIFIFDMGKPVKIVDLAKDLIKLSGLKEGEDIEIKFSGLRPGEKLYEELFNGSESFTNTINEKIYIAENSAKIVPDDFEEKLDRLLDLVQNPGLNEAEYKYGLKSLVPEFTFSNGEEVKAEWKNR